MYLETRREWMRRRRRRRILRRILIAVGVVAALGLSVPVISRITGHDVVRLVSEQSKKERPEGILPQPETVAALPETQAVQAETETGPPTTEAPAEPETNPALNENWMLILVNKDHPIPEGYEVPEFTELRNGNRVDSRIYPALQRMFDDAREAGTLPYITSSFRTMEKQQELMDQKIADYEAEGNSHEEAVRLAETWVAIPGTSEHQLGLSVDISSGNKETQDPTVVWKWLNENCWKYGFVQRYPEDKTEITGIIDEPWHYRYVGEEAAKEMTEKGLVLEEYLQQ